MSGGCIKKQMGDRSRQRRLSHPRNGLVANPAQIASPFKFVLPVAAHCIAKGAEKDSATRTKGAEVGNEDSRNRSSCAKDWMRSVGYRRTVASMSDGRASIKSAKRFPVPSMPGNNTIWIRPVDTTLMLAGAPACDAHEKRGFRKQQPNLPISRLLGNLVITAMNQNRTRTPPLKTRPSRGAQASVVQRPSGACCGRSRGSVFVWRTSLRFSALR